MLPSNNPDERALQLRIETVKKELDAAREDNDTLRASLLEDALNDLLDQYRCNICHT